MKYWIITKNDAYSIKIKEDLIQKIKHDLDDVTPDFVIAVGGDGTFIHAVHLFPEAVIFGLHTGSLGFYTNYTIQTMQDLISDLNTQSFKIDTIDLLKCEIASSKKEKDIHYALNEFTIFKSPRILTLNVYIDKEKLETFRGTGVCISTPYGSTAYNKSLHGAIVDPKVTAFQLTEIAGINSNAYRTISSPIVLSCEREVTLEPIEEEDICITIDNFSYEIEKFKNAKITLASKKIKVGYHTMPNFVQRIKRTFLKD